jgi:hypothetical protein
MTIFLRDLFSDGRKIALISDEGFRTRTRPRGAPGCGLTWEGEKL